MPKRSTENQPPAGKGRRPYAAPRILYRERLESVAVACLSPNAKVNNIPPNNCVPGQFQS